MKAWLFQKAEQLQKLGEEKCPWSVGWYDPDGNRRSQRVGCHSLAEKFRRKIEGQLAAGTYESRARTTWKAFRAEYEEKVADGMIPQTRQEMLRAINHFEKIVKPARLRGVKTQMIDKYIAIRRTQPGKNRKNTVSPATINKELRHIKAMLQVAVDWEYLPKRPKIKMLREPEKLPRYVTPEHFAKIYEACDSAVRPKVDHYTPAEWWRALLCFAYMTGWRISEPLALRWDDVSLDEGTAVTRHADNKGKRDDRTRLHPVVVEHLRRLVDASIAHSPMVFDWPHHDRTLWLDFANIQKAAGIHLLCGERHEHTPACHRYGFHDLRRAFATVNAETLSVNALQRLMRHKSYLTTKRYINMAEQATKAVDQLHVPDVLRNGEAG